MAELIGRQEGADEDVKDIDEASLDYGQDALHIDNSLLQEMEKENSVHSAQEPEQAQQSGAGEGAVLQEPAAPMIFTPSSWPSYTYD